MTLPMAIERIRKRFFSSIKENRWLDSLGKKGYLLIFRKENSYTFEITEKQLYYSVEWLDCAPDSEEGEAHIAAYEKNGIHLTASYSLWAYFVSEKPITADTTARQRVAKRYRNTALLIYAFDVIAAVLIGYQFAIRDFLESNQVLLKAPTMESSSNIVINLCRRLLYGAEIILYRYGKLCANLFGETKASLALGILIPLAVTLSVLGGFWLAEWLRNRPESDQKIVREEKHVCEKSEASGKIESDC